jgi:signal peptidase I
MRPATAFDAARPPEPVGLLPWTIAPAPDAPSRSILLAMVGVVVAVGVLGTMAWRLAGNSLFTIATPSMCPDLCVGTLVFDEPLHGPVHVGEVVTFRPPGTTTVFTHRVVRVLSDGSFKTAGDALGTVDPWTVPRGNVIGRVVANVRGLGWLWRSLPWVAAALAGILLIRRRIPASIRKQCDLLFVTVLLVVPLLIMRPLVRASIISWHRLRDGAVVMSLVNTGLLPAQYRVTGAPVVSRVHPGQILTMTGSPTQGGVVSMRELVSFSSWQWALFALVVVLPMLGFLARFVWHRLHVPRLRLAPVADPYGAPGGPFPPNGGYGYDSGGAPGWYRHEHSTGHRIEPPSRTGHWA